MYAKARGIPLERVETHVERDGSRERQGVGGGRVPREGNRTTLPRTGSV